MSNTKEEFAKALEVILLEDGEQLEFPFTYTSPWIQFTEPQGKKNLPSDDTMCQHDMTNYVGFTENYAYCRKCDHKEVRS